MAKSEPKQQRSVFLCDDFKSVQGTVSGSVVMDIGDITLIIDSDGKTSLHTSGDITVVTKGDVVVYSVSKDKNVTVYTNKLKAEGEKPAPNVS